MNRTIEKDHKETPILLPEKELLPGALRAFEEATGTATDIIRINPRFVEGRADAELQLGKGEKRARFVAEIKHTLPTAALGAVVAQLRRFKKPGMLITRYVTPPMAERLKELDIAFIDTAGNAYVNTPKFYVYVTGRKPPEVERAAKTIKVFRPTGLRVVFALLCKPELIKAPYRDIAKAAKVALGTVGWAMYDLRHLDYLVERGKRGRKFINKRKLLDAWVTNYAQTLRPKLYRGRFRAPERNWWKRIEWKHLGVFLGGEPAAAKITGYLKPEITTLYMAGEINELLLKHRLRKDPQGNVEILKTFWEFDYPWKHPTLAPPLLIYADLLATADDRNIETGKIIYDKYLARLIGED